MIIGYRFSAKVTKPVLFLGYRLRYRKTYADTGLLTVQRLTSDKLYVRETLKSRENKITVLIAEDHTIVREGLRMLLEAAPDITVVGEAEDGTVTISLCQKLKPDIVLMDISMPSLNGVEATRIINVECKNSKVIILSMYSDEEYVFKSLDAGASGFLVKKTASDDLLKAVREVYDGKAFFSPAVSKTVLDAYRKTSRSAEGDPASTHRSLLTPREREVLQLIAEGHTSRDIAKRLFVSLRTVRKHRENIMRKLDIHDVAGLTRYAMEKGIIQGKPPEIK